MRARLLTGVLIAVAALAGCGGGGDDKDKGEAVSCSRAVRAAVLDHVDTIVVGTKEVRGSADRVSIRRCRAREKTANASVIVFGIDDRRVRDQRHQVSLELQKGKWRVVRDLDTQRCRKGHGHRSFSSIECT